MLKRHSLAYLFARGGPAIISFLTIAILTRLMPTDAYGRYQLTVAGAAFAGISFRWLRLSLLRFLPAYKRRSKRLFSVLLTFFVITALAVGGVGFASLFFIDSLVWQGLIAVSVLFLWAKSWYELNLEILRSGLNPRLYGWLRFTKVSISLGVGVLLVIWGFGAFGPLLGLIAGMLVSGVGPTWKRWKKAIFHVRLIKSDISRQVLWYGLPLTASLAVGLILSVSDRLLIGWFIGESATGVYSASYDIAQQTITALMSVINLAAYPLAVNALEGGGKKAAYDQMSENGTLILAIGLPSTVGLIMLSAEFTTLFLGQEFREVGVQLLPWIAVGALLSGVRSFHYDLAFQLSNRTVNQIWVLGGAAIANVGLNLWLIPTYGAIGAAYSTVVSFAIALVLSIGIGRRVLRVPLVPEGWYKVAILALTMGAAIHFVEVEGVLKSLVARIGVGGAVYLAGAYAVDLLDTRRVSKRIIGQIAGAIVPWK